MGIQQGLSESLAGRFETIPLTHWSFTEMAEAFGLDLPRHIHFGGYPKVAEHERTSQRARREAGQRPVGTSLNGMPLSTRTSWGKPSTRSARMLSMISSLPPAMRTPGAAM